MARPKNDDKHPAIEFMRALYALTPGGYVELRAIPNDKLQKGKERRVFVTTPAELVEFAERYGHRKSEFGVYFGICKREERIGTKKGVGRIAALWVDVDTIKNGWDTDALLKLVHALPGVLRPSACVKSGGGLHLYWFLDKVVTKHADVEAVNVWLRELFAGDAVQNVDRIFRLPGTFNTKRKAARVEVAWCYRFERRSLKSIVDAVLDYPKCLGDDGTWTTKLKRVKSDLRLPKGVVDPLASFAAIYGGGNARQMTKNLVDMWANRVRYHAPRGYIGIHEAALVHTARLYIANPEYPEDTVVRIVLDNIKEVKDRDAPDEQWDMDREAELIRDMFRSWKPKWIEYERERRAQARKAKKNNGSTGHVRSGRGRLLHAAGRGRG